MASKGWVIAAALTALAAGGCDKESAKAGSDGAVSPAKSAEAKAEPPATAQPPRAPTLVLSDKDFSVDGTALTGAPAEWGPAVAGKPLIEGEAVLVIAMRDTKIARVEALVTALQAAKAKSVLIRTPTREQSTGEVELVLHHAAAAECSAVAMIEHDGSVALWSKAGGGAQKLPRGMAGPDLSSSTAALVKRAGACDSPVWFLGAADAVTWGLTFDLATRAKSAAEAGTPLRPKELVLLTHAPTAGKAVKED